MIEVLRADNAAECWDFTPDVGVGKLLEAIEVHYALLEELQVIVVIVVKLSSTRTKVKQENQRRTDASYAGQL